MFVFLKPWMKWILLSLSLYLASSTWSLWMGRIWVNNSKMRNTDCTWKTYPLVQLKGANLCKFPICCVIPGGTTERQVPPSETCLIPKPLQCRASTGSPTDFSRVPRVIIRLVGHNTVREMGPEFCSSTCKCGHNHLPSTL